MVDRSTARFRDAPASQRSKHLSAAVIVVTIAALAVVGLASGMAALAFFAVGAGAGYSLSGSV